MRAGYVWQTGHLWPEARGSALLAALLTVALVAAFSSQAFWQEWRSVAIEIADRSRLETDWLLDGTHDWARARLRDDAQRSSAVDHAGEAWAQPVVSLPLAIFWVGEETIAGQSAADSNASEAPPAPRVSQQLSDAQSKLNVMNLLDGQALSPLWLNAFDKLFEVLKLPPEQLLTLSQNLQQVSATRSLAGVDSTASAGSALLPQQTAQLVWLGLTPATLAALQAHVTLLPSRTPVNLNSASVEVLQSLLPSFKRSDAERVVALRQSKPLQTVADAGISDLQSEGQYSVSSRFFELHTEIESGAVSVAENALLQRDGASVRTLWRRRGMATENSWWSPSLSFQKIP
jgi:general secretion pathway protein K